MNTIKTKFIPAAICWVCALLTLTASRALADAPPGPSLGQAPPANPVRQLYLDRRMLIEAASADDPSLAQYGFGRSFGYRIGDIIPIQVRIAVKDAPKGEQPIQLNLDAVLSGSTTIEKLKEPMFELVRPARQEGEVSPWVVLSRTHEPVAFGRGDKQPATVWRLEMLVRTFRAGKSQPFTLQFLCATDMLPGGKSLDWKPVSSPALIIGRSDTVDGGEDLLMAEPMLASQPNVAAARPLLFAGMLLMLLPLTWLGWQALRKLLPEHMLTAEELAWRQLQPVFASGKSRGFTDEHYSTILTAVKQYFRIAAFTAAEVSAHQAEIADGLVVTKIVQTCEVDVLCRGITLATAQNDELQQQVEQVIPRP
jgi:hypothetical protein